jgi:hypothetical protein
MSYLPMAVIAVVGGMALLAAMYVHHELRPVPRKLPVPVRGRRVVPGDECFCGGIIGRTGLTSARFGDLFARTVTVRGLWMDAGSSGVRASELIGPCPPPDRTARAGCGNATAEPSSSTMPVPGKCHSYWASRHTGDQRFGARNNRRGPH